MRVRVWSVLAWVALVVWIVASAAEMRADTIFSNFGPSQTYSGVSWWNVGAATNPTGVQVVAFSFSPTATATLTGADLALAAVPPPGSAQTVTPLTVYIESSVNGQPGSILSTLTQTGTYSNYPATNVVSFACTSGCATLDAGTTYWIVGQQTDASNTTGWFFSDSDTGTWYYDETNSATGPWTAATAGDQYSAFDVMGALGAVPEPGSLALLGTGMLGMFAAARRRLRIG